MLNNGIMVLRPNTNCQNICKWMLLVIHVLEIIWEGYHERHLHWERKPQELSLKLLLYKEIQRFVFLIKENSRYQMQTTIDFKEFRGITKYSPSIEVSS